MILNENYATINGASNLITDIPTLHNLAMSEIETDMTTITAAVTTLQNNNTGTNTGDETATTIKTKLSITTLSGSNTGDETNATILSKLGATLVTGSNTGDQVISDATISTTDITTNNVSATKHGFAPKFPNNTTTFLRGDGTYATPSGAGNVTGPGSAVSGNIATYNGTTGTIIQDGGKALPTGAIVGISDTQTLTNKTLTSPFINDTTSITTTGTELNLLHGNLGAWSAWTPGFTGFSSAPVVTARYIQIGKTCICSVYTSSGGTSNGTGFTITLPVAAANVSQYAYGAGFGVDNGAATVVAILTSQNSTTANIYKATPGNSWTASGTKNANFTLTYETV